MTGTYIRTDNRVRRSPYSHKGNIGESDEKQHTTYEIICCTFLMGLIKDGRDAGTKLGQYLSHTLTGSSTTNTTNLIEQLEARGGVDQLLMFLTGAAGAGKSTAVKVRT